MMGAFIMFSIASLLILAKSQFLPGQSTLPTLCLIINGKIYANGVDKGVATAQQQKEYEKYTAEVLAWPQKALQHSLLHAFTTHTNVLSGSLFSFHGAITVPTLPPVTNSYASPPVQPDFCKL
ncbi:hypothetical protein Tcan_12694 [Toxocara canis]|uniref:Pepsin inhibitor-3-like repeated domain-containing protein n=1 Tax=Toxocara canis TaxID=6265 RepID=A0A0B2V2J2_TOXCA|nr:hypothetical protein Tcan_12694 [Toxocara canis]